MKVITVVFSIFLILVLVGLVGFMFIYVNNGFSNYCIEYRGQQIYNSQSDIELKEKEYNVFHVVNFVSKSEEDIVLSGDYEVRIFFANSVKNNASVKLSGEEIELDSIDVTKAFSISQNDSTFTLYFSEKGTLKEIFEKVYPRYDVVILKNYDLWEEDCFVLQVNFLNDNKKINISFH